MEQNRKKKKEKKSRCRVPLRLAMIFSNLVLKAFRSHNERLDGIKYVLINFNFNMLGDDE